MKSNVDLIDDRSTRYLKAVVARSKPGAARGFQRDVRVIGHGRVEDRGIVPAI